MNKLLGDKDFYEAPDFQDECCEFEDCGEDAEEEFKGKWYCKGRLEVVSG